MAGPPRQQDDRTVDPRLLQNEPLLPSGRVARGPSRDIPNVEVPQSPLYHEAPEQPPVLHVPEKVQEEWHVAPKGEAEPDLELDFFRAEVWDDAPSFVPDGGPLIHPNIREDNSSIVKQRVYKVRIGAKDVGTSEGPREDHSRPRVDNHFLIMLLLGSGRCVSLFMKKCYGSGGIGKLSICRNDMTRPDNILAFHDLRVSDYTLHFDESKAPPPHEGWVTVERFMHSIKRSSGQYFRFSIVAGKQQGTAHWVEVMLECFRQDGLTLYPQDERRRTNDFLRYQHDAVLAPRRGPLMPGIFLSAHFMTNRQYSKEDAEDEISTLDYSKLYALTLALAPGMSEIRRAVSELTEALLENRRRDYENALERLRPTIQNAATVSEYRLTSARDLLNASQRDLNAFADLARDGIYTVAQNALNILQQQTNRWDNPIYALIATIDLGNFNDLERVYL